MAAMAPSSLSFLSSYPHSVESKTGCAPLRTQRSPHRRSTHRLLQNRRQQKPPRLLRRPRVASSWGSGDRLSCSSCRNAVRLVRDRVWWLRSICLRGCVRLMISGFSRHFLPYHPIKEGNRPGLTLRSCRLASVDSWWEGAVRFVGHPVGIRRASLAGGSPSSAIGLG